MVTSVFQFAVRVTESASGKSGVATVIVNVIRDRSPPVFSRDRIDVTIDETKPVNEGVVTLVATDPDLKVFAHFIFFSSANFNIVVVCVKIAEEKAWMSFECDHPWKITN